MNHQIVTTIVFFGAAVFLSYSAFARPRKKSGRKKGPTKKQVVPNKDEKKAGSQDHGAKKGTPEDHEGNEEKPEATRRDVPKRTIGDIDEESSTADGGSESEIDGGFDEAGGCRFSWSNHRG